MAKNNSSPRRPQSKGKDTSKQRRYGRNDKRRQFERADFRDNQESKVSNAYDNDISWYSKYPELLAAAASVPYPYRPGMVPPLVDPSQASKYVSTPIPGVMCLSFVPSIGKSTEPTDPASIAVKEIYARVRSAFSGRLYADPPDFMVYLVALDSIFSYIAWLKRVYRCINAYTPLNYQLPETVLSAMGFSNSEIQALRASKTEFWQDINTLVQMTKKFTCPAVMDYFNRHYWMNDNIYTDAQTVNSQFYMFNQERWYQFTMLPEEDVSSTMAGGLRLWSPTNPSESATSVPKDVAGLFSFGVQLINALAASDDAYTIAGYLAKAYEGIPSFVVDEIDQNAVLEPVYSEEVLSQIENSHTMSIPPSYIDFTSLDITQKVTTNVIYWDGNIALTPAGKIYQQTFTDQRYLNPIISIRSDSPTVADTIIATRLNAHFGFTTVASSDTVNVATKCATEIPICWKLWSNSKQLGIYNSFIIYSPENTVSGYQLQLQMLAVASQFDWAPISVVGTAKETGGQVTLFTFGDTHNYTVVPRSQLAEMHKVCIYSEFNAFNQ